MSQQKKYTDLTDNVNDGVGFDLRGKEYFLRYPLTHEVEEMKELSDAVTEYQRQADNAGTQEVEDQYKEKAKEAGDKLENFIYGLITAVNHDTHIRDALKNENIKVMRNFNTMVRTELSLEG